MPDDRPAPMHKTKAPRAHGRQHLTQQAAFLGMAVFAGKDVGHQPQLGLPHRQGLPRQGGALVVRVSRMRCSVAKDERATCS